MNSNFHTDKDNVYAFLKKLNGDIVSTIADMKNEFDKNPSS
jgi:hypothetical protein